MARILGFFWRMWLIYALSGAVFLIAVDGAHCQLSRLNYLKNRVEQYLVGYESGQAAYSRELLYLSARYFQLLSGMFPDDALYRGALGYCRFQLGEVGRAVDLYRQAIALEPNVYTLYLDLGEIFYYQGDLDQACRYLVAGIERLPAGVDFYSQLDRLLSPLRDDRLAAWSLVLKSRARRDDEQAFHLLAQCAAQKGYYTRMRETAEAGLARHPQSRELQLDRALARVLLNEPSVLDGLPALASSGLGPGEAQLAALLREDQLTAGDQRAAVIERMRQSMRARPVALHVNSEFIFLRQRILWAKRSGLIK